MIGKKDKELSALRVALKRQIEVGMHVSQECTGWRKAAENWKRSAIKARRLAVVAVLACPGSFVAGGLLLQPLLEWWW